MGIIDKRVKPHNYDVPVEIRRWDIPEVTNRLCSRRNGANKMKWKDFNYGFAVALLTGAIFWVLVAILASGCQCKVVWTDSIFAGGCSLCAETVLNDASIEPNSIQLGEYRGNTDDIEAITPYGTLKTK